VETTYAGVPPHVRDLLGEYYAVFAGNAADPGHALDRVVAPGWVNRNGLSTIGLAEYLGMVGALRAAVPDLRWVVEDVFVAGRKAVVRGNGSGTPRVPVLGLPATGRSFSIMSIDIHVLADDRIAESWHLEDWAGAFRQLESR